MHMRHLLIAAGLSVALSGVASAQTLTITSPEFKAGGSIPSKFTCDASPTAPVMPPNHNGLPTCTSAMSPARSCSASAVRPSAADKGMRKARQRATSSGMAAAQFAS